MAKVNPISHAQGSVRVDIVGGTLDLRPINLILPNVVTINMATSLKAIVDIESAHDQDCAITLESVDYQMTQAWNWEDIKNESGPLSFIAQILLIFERALKNQNIKIKISSKAPAGSGLGGSSAMGVTLYKGLAEFLNLEFNPYKAIDVVNSLEAKILNKGPAGYQDYYPALFGGLLALHPRAEGIEVEQLYEKDFCDELRSRITLISSDISRNSGINNWEVYKSFFDHKNNVRQGLETIAQISFEAYHAFKSSDLEKLLNLISQEGQARRKLFKGIVCPEVSDFFNDLSSQIPDLGMKVCGAGGGGCFLLVHPEGKRDIIRKYSEKHSMRVLNFEIQKPLTEI